MDFVVGKNVFGAEERLVNETKEINILYMVCGEWNQRDDDVNAVESRSLWLKREMQRTGKKLHFVASNVIQRPKRQAKRTETRIYSEQMMKIPIIFFFGTKRLNGYWAATASTPQPMTTTKENMLDLLLGPTSLCPRRPALHSYFIW